MNDEELRQEAATSTDMPRLAAASPDSDYSLSIEDAAVLCEQAGYPCTLRTI